MFWSKYSAKAIALIQAQGMPIDMEVWNLIQENKAGDRPRAAAEIRSELWQCGPDLYAGRRVELRTLRTLARSVGITHGRACRVAGSTSDSDAFRLMYPRARHRGPACVARQPRRDRARQVADRSRRSQPSQSVPVWHRDRPQRTCQIAYSTFTPPCARSWCFRPTRSAFYLDWRTQEVGVAAADPKTVY